MKFSISATGYHAFRCQVYTHTSCMLDLNILSILSCMFIFHCYYSYWVHCVIFRWAWTPSYIELWWWHLDATWAISESITASSNYLPTQSNIEYTSGLMCRLIFYAAFAFSKSHMHLLWHTVYIICFTETCVKTS